MKITGTSSIVGTLTIELRDPFERAYRSLNVKNGEIFEVPDKFRFAAAVTDAVTRGLITITLEDDDEAVQEDL